MDLYLKKKELVFKLRNNKACKSMQTYGPLSMSIRVLIFELAINHGLRVSAL